MTATTLSRPIALVAAGSLVALGSLVVGSALGPVAPAQAHNYLVGTTPDANSTVTELPELISITTNDTLLDLSGTGAGFGLLVTDADGRYYGDGCLTISGPTMSTPAALGEAGEYTVTWQVVSTDGHPVSDSFEFDWAPAASVLVTQGYESQPVCGEDPADAGETATAAPTSGTDDDTDGESRAANSELHANLPWIIGAVLAVGVAIGATLLLTRPRKKPGSTDAEPGDTL